MKDQIVFTCPECHSHAYDSTFLVDSDAKIRCLGHPSSDDGLIPCSFTCRKEELCKCLSVMTICDSNKELVKYIKTKEHLKYNYFYSLLGLQFTNEEG
jgi:hypothetical protein